MREALSAGGEFPEKQMRGDQSVPWGLIIFMTLHDGGRGGRMAGVVRKR